MLSTLTGVVLAALLVAITVTDVRRRVIPNRPTLAGAVAAIALSIAGGDPGALVERVLAAGAAGGFLLAAALVRPDGMGMGDVKLAAVLGLFLGEAVAVALLAALLSGTLAGLWLLARDGAASTRGATLPFGPFLALGAAIGWVAGADALAWYAQ